MWIASRFIFQRNNYTSSFHWKMDKAYCIISTYTCMCSTLHRSGNSKSYEEIHITMPFEVALWIATTVATPTMLRQSWSSDWFVTPGPCDIINPETPSIIIRSVARHTHLNLKTFTTVLRSNLAGWVVVLSTKNIVQIGNSFHETKNGNYRKCQSRISRIVRHTRPFP